MEMFLLYMTSLCFVYEEDITWQQKDLNNIKFTINSSLFVPEENKVHVSSS